MRVREFRSEIWLPMPPDEIFPFFADAANLEILTPPWLSFKIITPPPIAMREGSVIDYKLRIHGEYARSARHARMTTCISSCIRGRS